MNNHTIKIVTAILLLFIVSCNFFKSGNSSVNQLPHYSMLDSALIFDYSAASSFEVTPEASAHARRIFLNAIDVFINNKNPEGSLPLFLESIRTEPASDSYLRFGDALLACKYYSDARKAYKMSASLTDNPAPDANLGVAKCMSLMGDTSMAISYLEMAFESFPFDKATIENDPAFSSLNSMPEFKLLIARYLEDEDARLPKLLALFARNFPEAELPFTIQPDSLMSYTWHSSIDYRFADLIPDLSEGEFDRDVSKDFQYYAALKLSEGYKTLIYSSVDMLSDTMNPVHIYMANINNDGELLFQQEIACFCSPLTLKSVEIGTDGKITIREIAQTWKVDPLYKGYSGNEVVKQEVQETKVYSITNTGELVEVVSDYRKAPEVVNVEVR